MDFITREEAQEALKRGERVLFHYQGKSTEVTLDTDLNDLRDAFLAKFLTIDDVVNGKYSILRCHELKVCPEYFETLEKRIKTFEIRKNDRDFHIGDVLILKEFDPETNNYTGRTVERKVTYITNFAQQEGYVVMSIV
ncbi:ASCH/PUA domain-containing protein [Caldibacillus debilis]|uniref:DUF3850 domain-containing protein n=1 Tax=Caldibacillus debilis GB1 TaxID=1339248 RepID=A0A420VEH2_9BACI|nr:ASCH/PUA domain-containing protein [Caldibacillus debilis]RKO61808.1 Protein of Unknown Function with PDB structure (DUF3850) [Caldibacillus debilis GB1]